MRDRHLFDAFYTFERAAPADYALWQRCFLWFLRKVTLRYSGGGRGSAPKPLLIKSPVHTARIALLLRLFPRARFVYVHRDPLDVFASARNMASKYYGCVWARREYFDPWEDLGCAATQECNGAHLVPAGIATCSSRRSRRWTPSFSTSSTCCIGST